MYKAYLHLILVFFVFLQLTSCITARKVNYLQKPDNVIPAYKDSLSYSDYLISIGDKVFVRVYSTQEETNTIFNGPTNQLTTMNLDASNPNIDLFAYTVQPNGSILFPMIGEVAVAGMSVRDATHALEQAIAPIYKFSSVEIRLVNRYYSVIGSNRSGRYPILREKVNIFQALALAGDIGSYGDRSKIRILRETENGTVIKTFDIRSEDIIHSQYYYIQPNDVIYIQTLDEQFFSILNLPSLLATAISTFSMGAFIYNIVLSPASN
ncbi:MAG: polysaccharide biosynthesis/export family protein [Paludibacter sp.]|nr:polysaccharide biosynthesis/export family protein [Paludibacter sp.]